MANRMNDATKYEKRFNAPKIERYHLSQFRRSSTTEKPKDA